MAMTFWLGNEHDDTLHGGAGNDILDGGSGNDMLYGDNGADTVIFKLLENFENDAVGGNGLDIWSDFSISQQDKIDISDLLIGNVGAQNLSTFIQLGKNGTTIALSIDRDGSDTTYDTQSILTLWNQPTINNLQDLIALNTFII